MSYLTITADDERRAMKMLATIGEAYEDDADIRADLHDLLKLATGRTEILVAK